MKQTLILMEHGTAQQKALSVLLSGPDLNRYACFGSVAPDIFHFYHIFSKKKNLQSQIWGNRSHHSGVIELILNFLDRISAERDIKKKNKLLSFTAGYICHCAVDVVTHPYIFYFTGNYYSKNRSEAAEAQANHLRIEYTLDSYLVQHRWGLNPYQYNFLQYLEPDISTKKTNNHKLDFDIWFLWVNALAGVFPEEFENEYNGSREKMVKGDILNESYLGFLKFNRMVDTRHGFVRYLLKTVDMLTLRRIKSRNLIMPPRKDIDIRIPNEQHLTWKYPADPEKTSIESFIDLVHRSARISAQIIIEAIDYLEGKMSRDDFVEKYGGYNLDTGLRSESIQMVEFNPLEEKD